MATSTETKIIEIKVPINEGIQQIKLLTDEITKLSAGQAALKKGSDAEKIQYEKNAIAIKEYTRQKQVLSREIQTEIKSAQSAMGAYDKLQIAYTKAQAKAKDLAASNTATATQIKKAADEANKLNQQLKDIDKTIGQSQRYVGEYERGWKGVGTGLQSMPGTLGNVASSIASTGKAMLAFVLTPAGAIITAIAAIGAGVVALVKNAQDFAKEMSMLSAITGATGKDLDFLKDKAKDLGAEYGKSATEIVVAMKMVGSAKPELLDNVEALSAMTESVLVLSKATGLDLSESTASLTTIMNQFGFGAEDANKAINVLAAGSKYGAVEVDYLKESIVKVGTIAASAGLSIEQTTAAMELFGQMGVRAETAGTGFKSILGELQSDTSNYTNGVFDLNKAIENNAGISNDNIALQQKFGKEFYGLAGILFKNKELFNELTTNITGTNVAFEQMAIANDNLNGDTEKLSGTWDKFMLSIEDGSGILSKAARGLVQYWTKVIEVITTGSKWIGQGFDFVVLQFQYGKEAVFAFYKTTQIAFSAIGNAWDAIKKGDFKGVIASFSGVTDAIKKTLAPSTWKGKVDAENALTVIAKKNAEKAKEIVKVEDETKKEIVTNNKKSEKQITVDKKTEEEKRLADLRAYLLEQDKILNQKISDYKKSLTPKEATLLDKVTSGASAVLNAAVAENNAIIENDKKAADEQAKTAEDLKQKKIQAAFDAANAGADILQGAFEFTNALAEAELATWAKQNKGKANFDEEYAKKRAELEHKAAVRNKVMQVVNSLINTAAAVVAQLSVPGAGPALAIAAGIAGALQTAAIIATPIPDKNATSGATSGGSGVGMSSTPALTSQMASPLTNSVSAMQATGGSNAITSGAANLSNAPAFDYNAMANIMSKMPAPELSIVELRTKEKQVDFIDNVSTLKS